MLKIVGVILIILSGSAMGFKASENLILQNNRLKQLKKIIIMLRGEVNFNHSTIGEAFSSISNKTNAPFNDFFRYISVKLENYSGEPLVKVWKEAVKCKLSNAGLSTSHLQKLGELGENLGYLDKEMQIKTFDLYLEQLEQEILENNNKMKDNCKLYKCLGVMGGILVTLIIV